MLTLASGFVGRDDCLCRVGFEAIALSKLFSCRAMALVIASIWALCGKFSRPGYDTSEGDGASYFRLNRGVGYKVGPCGDVFHFEIKAGDK